MQVHYELLRQSDCVKSSYTVCRYIIIYSIQLNKFASPSLALHDMIRHIHLVWICHKTDALGLLDILVLILLPFCLGKVVLWSEHWNKRQWWSGLRQLLPVHNKSCCMFENRNQSVSYRFSCSSDKIEIYPENFSKKNIVFKRF